MNRLTDFSRHYPAEMLTEGMAATMWEGTARKGRTRKCVRLLAASTIAADTNRQHFSPIWNRKRITCALILLLGAVISIRIALL